jgi:hypothetical protein
VRFRYAPSGQEAIAPLEPRGAKSYTFGFDHTGGAETGVAIARATTATDSQMDVIVRDDAGSQIAAYQIDIPLPSHTSFVMSSRFPETAGRTGTIEFKTASAAQISVLGVRAPTSGRFTTLSVAGDLDSGSGGIPHLAVGDLAPTLCRRWLHFSKAERPPVTYSCFPSCTRSHRPCRLPKTHLLSRSGRALPN